MEGTYYNEKDFKTHTNFINAYMHFNIFYKYKGFCCDTSLNESTTNEVTTTYNLSETSLSNDTKAVSLPSDKSDYIKSDLSPLTSKVIVLDPGHCKKHIGARGYGLKEEDIVLVFLKHAKTN